MNKLSFLQEGLKEALAEIEIPAGESSDTSNAVLDVIGVAELLKYKPGTTDS